MKEEDIIEAVKQFAKQTEARPNYYETHLLPTMEEGERWCLKLGADCFVVRIACLLHDCGYSFLDSWEHHEEAGAAVAKKFLEEQGVPEKIAEQVAMCIRLHDGKVTENDPIECRIVNDADIIAYYKFIGEHVKQWIEGGRTKDKTIAFHINHAKMHWNDLRVKEMKEYAKQYYEEALRYLEAMR
ncbi:MAG: HD domain-containing protein [Candidatus Diapherotrites archaeon]|nr:HD domain-containing protein [Candidatus Diapherotrites archaeon]